jgi:hypothetical protein
MKSKIVRIHYAHLQNSERLYKLEREYKASPNIQSAFQTLSLHPIITHLFEVNREYDTMLQEYIEETSEAERINMADLRKVCIKALGQYFDAIEYCVFDHEENDYQPLIKDLEKLNFYYNQQLKARATRSKKTINERPIKPPKA